MLVSFISLSASFSRPRLALATSYQLLLKEKHRRHVLYMLREFHFCACLSFSPASLPVDLLRYFPLFAGHGGRSSTAVAAAPHSCATKGEKRGWTVFWILWNSCRSERNRFLSPIFRKMIPAFQTSGKELFLCECVYCFPMFQTGPCMLYNAS